MTTPGTLSEIINILINVLNAALNVVILLAFFVFAWGVSQFILNADNNKKKTRGKEILIWGVIILFVVVSIKGIITIVLNTIL